MIGDLLLKDRLTRYRLSLWALVVAGLLIVMPACGKRGPPLPPLRPAPGPVTELTLTRRGEDVLVRFVTPTANLDGSAPLLFDRVEVYALTIGAGGRPPTPLQLMQHANLLTVLGKVEPPVTKTPAAADTAAPPASTAGRVITFVDKGIKVPPPVVAPAPAATAGIPVPTAAPVVPPTAPVVPPTAPVVPPAAPNAPILTLSGPLPTNAVRYYLIQSFANSRRIGGSQTVGVELFDPPARPEGVALAYDEQTLTLTWTLVPGDSYLVYPSGSAVPADAAAIMPAPIKVATAALPVVFGTRVCFVVRSVTGTRPVLTESAPSDEACVTPVDTFPPPAPSGLVAVASPGAISLTWDPVTAADLGGYIVLRGEGSSDRLQPLMTEPVSGASFNDQTAKAGVRYFYAVIAVDKASPANRSKNSNVVEETGR